MAEQDHDKQDRRPGGSRPEAPDDPETGPSAVGRDTPVRSPLDADEALGNRTGGYGGNPPSLEPEAEEPPSGS